MEKSDVLMENFVKGTMEKWGLGYETLKEINPWLIYAKISGYGNEGLEQYTQKTAFDIIGIIFTYLGILLIGFILWKKRGRKKRH